MKSLYTIQLTKKEIKTRRVGGIYFSKIEEPMIRQGVLTPKTRQEALNLIGIDLCQLDLRLVEVLDPYGNTTDLMGCVGLAIIDTDRFKIASDETLFNVDVVLKYDFKKAYNERFTHLASKRYIIDLELISE